MPRGSKPCPEGCKCGRHVHVVDQEARVAKMRENPNWIASTRGRFKGGKVRKDGRVEVYARGRYRPRARVVMEQHLGRILEPHEHVHHKNEDPTDDRIENLQVLTRAEHKRLHEQQDRERGVPRRPNLKCAPGCTCKKHDGRGGRYWSAGKKCEPGCTCRKHRATNREPSYIAE